MTQTNTSYIVVCEGNSEYAYIQKLNRFFAENGYACIINAKRVDCGHFNEVQRKYKTEKKNNPRTTIYIWVDKDTYVRNDCGDKDKYKSKANNLPKFMFSTMNFEDFLAMHQDAKTLDIWYQVCSRQKHHINPMTEDVYIALVDQHLFKDYKKGDIPFDITEDCLKTLFVNNKGKHMFRCDFADFIEMLISKHSSIE